MTSRPPLPARYYRDDHRGIGSGGPQRRPGPTRIQASRRRAQVRRRRRVLLALTVPALIAALMAWSLIGALLTPGNQGFSAKWADWLRSHHASYIANKMEAAYYSHTAPAKGGHPKALNPLPGAPVTTTPVAAPAVRAHLTPPAPVPLVVTPGLSGEGQWQPVGPTVGGLPGMYEAQFRADTVYTSEITSAVWVDPLLMHIALVPGSSEPGGTWSQPPYITTAQLPSIAAAFNGGFRFADAKGGFYLDGRTAVPLQAGAASMVIHSNGRIDIGSWNSEVSMTPDVTAVLQNLVPLVDNGQVSASATYNDVRIWGSTLGAAVVVARSGIGVTASGALVYVAGPALTAKSLAESLQRAGAVRAMALDINPEWVTWNFFSHPNAADPAQVTAAKLYPQMQRPATRYLGPTAESRDFFTVSADS